MIWLRNSYKCSCVREKVKSKGQNDSLATNLMSNVKIILISEDYMKNQIIEIKPWDNVIDIDIDFPGEMVLVKETDFKINK